MIAEIILEVLLLAVGAWLGLSPACDLIAWMKGQLWPAPRDAESGAEERLLFLIPAHNEELLIARCVKSITDMRFPFEQREIVVIADNCSDATARIAARFGARVLERRSTSDYGKGHAIGWALRVLNTGPFSAVVIVDADTLVEPDFADAITRWTPLRDKALQTYDGLSNEFQNALTRMAGLLTRNRYDISLKLKARAGLNCPLTGDGVILGMGVLERFPWEVSTITEGWELYTKFTVEGQRVFYVSDARLYAQEATSLASSKSQRERWASGRLAVLRKHARDILTRSNIDALQRLDLVAELSNLGPITHCMISVFGIILLYAAAAPHRTAIALLLSLPILHQSVLSLVSLGRHPQRMRTLASFVLLPPYAFWRVWVAARALYKVGRREWVRTERT